MKNVCCIFILCFLFNCNTLEKPKKPDNLIPKNEMTNILYDVFLLNSVKGYNKSKLEKQGIFPETYIFTKYDIDSLQFALSNNYYAYNIETYDAIIKDVKERIDATKKIFDTIVAKEKKERDSLQKIKKQKKDSLRKTDSLRIKALDTIIKRTKTTLLPE